MKKEKITLEQIAKELGVSKMTVSKALNNSTDISKETKRKVMEKINAYGYVKNEDAISFRTGKNKTIIVIFNDLSNPYFSFSCQKSVSVLKELGFNASLYFCTNYELTMEDVQKISHTKCSGILSFVYPNKDFIDYVNDRTIPFSLVGIKNLEKGIDSFYTDDYDGGYKIGQYCKNKGFKNALMVNDTFSETGIRREKGFVDSLKDTDCIVNVVRLKKHEAYNSFVNRLFNTIANSNCDFIMFVSDNSALNCIRKLKANNYKKTLCIFGYDNLNKYSNLIKEINSVDYDQNSIINDACVYLIKKIKDEIEYRTQISLVYPTKIKIVS